MIEVLLVFLAVTVADYCWAEYIKDIATGSAFKASIWAILVYVLGGFVVLEYVANKWMLIPAGLGAFIGTYISVKRKKDVNKSIT